MIVNYTGGTGQQRSWFESALAHMQFPWDSNSALTVNVSWPDEPSAPGHKEYACTTQQADYNHFALEIRNTLDTDVGYLARNSPLGDGRPPSSLQNFYMECVAHELAHVLWFHLIDSPSPPTLAPICAWFVKHEQGTGEIVGTPADLHPVGAKWEDMLQEGVAETLKDSLLPEGFREYDNRTKWSLKKENYDAFMSLFINTIDGGPGTERVRIYLDTMAPPGTPGFIPVASEWGLTYITDEGATYLKPNEGYPRVRYVGSHLGSPVQGLIDYPDFWKPGKPEGHHDGQLLDPTHRQDGHIDQAVDDTGVTVGPEVLITDPEGPVVGGNPYLSLIWMWGIYNFAGLVQLSQFVPDPLGIVPPYPYKDPQVVATNALWAAVRFKTR